ncbi:MAG: hypothetical protein LQ338_005334 [Usnochroma carphineum]|nr:MAG: hypothetical protein LQ338_005334 [Usnochroma carphineum]
MDPFSLSLPNNAVVTGLRTPPLPTSPAKDTPLVIAIHGGSYSAYYFDATPSNSVLPISNFLRVPCVAMNRPGYLDSTALASLLLEDSTYCQEEGKYLHHEILPAIWRTYNEAYGVSSIVILAHSLSVPMTVVAAALNAREDNISYPLSGIILHGLGTQLNTKTQESIHTHTHTDLSSPHIRFPIPLKDELMLCGLADQEVLDQSERLNTFVSLAELADGGATWQTYWQERYARYVRCPVLYNLAGEDQLWVANEGTVQEFAGAFTGSVRVEKEVVVGVPHCMELGRAGRGWYARCFGWAIECGVAFGEGKI